MRTLTHSLRPALALWLGVLAAPQLLAAQTQGVNASGFGVRVSKAVGSLAATPSVALTGGRNLDGATVDRVTLPGTVGTGLVSTISTGASDPGVTGSQTTSTVADVSVLNGLITARQLVASASSTVSDGVARSDAQGSSVSGLTVAGVTLGEQLPAPNTRIALPGVGYVILNEQIVTGDGRNRTGMTVNLVHVVLQGSLGAVKTGEIILGSASSSASR